MEVLTEIITVELQDSFSYFPVILFILLCLAGTLLILFLPTKCKKKKKKIPVQKKLPPQSITALKEKYIHVLTDIEKKRTEEQITDRQAFQAVSKVVRDFAYATTGIKVQNYTLMEIHAANMPKLYELISCCYIPEFAVEANGNVYEVINKARMVISEWN